MVAGDVVELTFNHPDEGSGSIFPKAGEEFTLKLGGFISDDDGNGVAGSGEMIDVMKATRWEAEGPVAWDNNVAEDLEKLARMAASTKLADWTIQHVSGTIYGGKGKPVGDMAGNLGKATIALKLQGGGALEKVG